MCVGVRMCGGSEGVCGCGGGDGGICDVWMGEEGAAFSYQLIATLNKVAAHSFSNLGCYDGLCCSWSAM